jgi:glycosyltransferase involved in cell wall biosynthesis
LADEVVVVDGGSTDKTVELARERGARIIITDNPSMFHLNKQKAMDACNGDWILQLDADERVTPELAREIKLVLAMTNEQIDEYQNGLKERELFLRHQKLVQPQPAVIPASSSVIPAEAGIHAINFNSKKSNYRLDSRVRGNDTQRNATHYTLHDYNAFFIPRLNYFLGGYLRYGGVYPDGVVRLIRKGKARLPCKDVHELMEVEGRTGWLTNPLIHKDSPTFKRYLERNSRYIDHLALELRHCHSRGGGNPVDNHNNGNYCLDPRLHGDDTITQKIYLFFDWVVLRPTITFFSMLIRHKGILDGWRGVVFAFFSSIRFARAYFRYKKSFSK